MPPLTIDTSDTRDCSKPLLFECAWEVANKGTFTVFHLPYLARLSWDRLFRSGRKYCGAKNGPPLVPTNGYCSLPAASLTAKTNHAPHCITAVNLITDALIHSWWYLYCHQNKDSRNGIRVWRSLLFDWPTFLQDRPNGGGSDGTR